MKTNREGFTIVEVVIAMMLLSIVLTMLAGMTYYTTRTAVAATDMTAANGYSVESMNRLTALPYASLPGEAGCDTVGTTGARYQRCVTVSVASSSSTVTLTTTGLQRDRMVLSMSLLRAAPPPSNPLCVSGGC